jgi:integration host factor subunit beta
VTNNTFNKSDLSEKISKSLNLSSSLTSDYLAQLCRVLASSIAIKNRAEFRDFGIFVKKTIRPRKFINPKTKNVSFLGETHTIIFSHSKNLLDD